MKKLIMAGIITGTMAFTFTACSNKDIKLSSSAIVPNGVLDKFHQRYPNAKYEEWEFNNNLYVVKFGPHNKIKAHYTAQGDFVRVDG